MRCPITECSLEISVQIAVGVTEDSQKPQRKEEIRNRSLEAMSEKYFTFIRRTPSDTQGAPRRGDEEAPQARARGQNVRQCTGRKQNRDNLKAERGSASDGAEAGRGGISTDDPDSSRGDARGPAEEAVLAAQAPRSRRKRETGHVAAAHITGGGRKKERRRRWDKVHRHGARLRGGAAETDRCSPVSQPSFLPWARCLPFASYFLVACSCFCYWGPSISQCPPGIRNTKVASGWRQRASKHFC